MVAPSSSSFAQGRWETLHRFASHCLARRQIVTLHQSLEAITYFTLVESLSMSLYVVYLTEQRFSLGFDSSLDHLCASFQLVIRETFRGGSVQQ